MREENYTFEYPAAMLLEHLMFSAHTFQGLPLVCADSKRQRRPALFRPVHPIPK
jgi:hypothetical protein